jgi:hypothetical protein
LTPNLITAQGQRETVSSLFIRKKGFIVWVCIYFRSKIAITLQTWIDLLFNILKTGGDILTLWIPDFIPCIPDFNFTNSRFHHHEFTISISQIHDFNFTNSNSLIHEFMNSRFQLHKFTSSTSRMWNREFTNLNSWRWNRVIVNSWS